MHQLLRRGLFSFSSIQQILKGYGIINANIVRNLSVPELYESGLGHTPGDPDTRKNLISSTGAFVAFSGLKTGRMPAAKSVVNDPIREKDIAWGEINKPLSASSFQIL
jgi:phosphoenolpyruvate carboxykinase (ATP)